MKHIFLILFTLVVEGDSFTHVKVPFRKISTCSNQQRNTISPLNLFGSSSSKTAKIPTSLTDRDKNAINSVKEAISSPKVSTFPLIECEFPILNALNKLGDGSLRSTKEAEKANLDFVAKMIQNISPVPFIGPKTWLIVGSAASKSFASAAKTRVKNAQFHSLREGIPMDVGKGDVCFLLNPSSSSDYQAAKKLAQTNNVGAVVIINGFAKDPKSIPSTATMAYFLKPLTYNSQIAGYLIRSYPSLWTVLDAETKQVLGSFSDNDILVSGTNTPDLREAGRLVQKSVNERAMLQRKK